MKSRNYLRFLKTKPTKAPRPTNAQVPGSGTPATPPMNKSEDEPTGEWTSRAKLIFGVWEPNDHNLPLNGVVEVSTTESKW